MLGGGPNAIHQVQLVRQCAADVVFFPHATQITAEQREQLVARAIGIVEGTVVRLVVADDKLTGVEMKDGSVVRRDAVFVGPRFLPRADLMVRLGCAVDENGWVVAEASAAAIAINADLVEQDVQHAVETLGGFLPTGR